MAIYPRAYVGLPVTASFWNAGRPDWYWKSSDTTISNDAVLDDDPDLIVPSLDVGTYYIRTRLMARLSANTSAVDINVAWAHSGTATGTHSVLGPETGLGVNSYWDGAAHQITTTVRALARISGSTVFTTTTQYGLRDTFAHMIAEDGILDVTAAGAFSIKWSQAASSATQLTVMTGSYLRVERIA